MTTVGSGGTFDGAVSHVANRNVFQTVDVEVVTTSGSRAEFDLNSVSEDTTAVSGKIGRADSDTDRAWNISCSAQNKLITLCSTL